MKTYIYKNCMGEELKVRLGKTSYRNNGTLAVIMLYDNEYGEEEEYGVLTVNIGESDLMADNEQAFIDTNNWNADIVKWLVKNKIAHKTPFIGFSGFCQYPLVMFTKEALDNMAVIE